MSDPNAGRYQRLYQREFDLAVDVLSDLLLSNRGSLVWSDDDYQAFIYQEPDQDVVLIFYPHKTTAGNHHLRIRDQQSLDKVRALDLMARLQRATNTCTFSVKNGPDWDAVRGINAAWERRERKRAKVNP